MSGGKKIFQSPFIGIDDKGTYPVIFDVRGNFSVFIKMQNPCLQFNGDSDEYYIFLNVFSNLVRSLDAGYTVQKHDIFSKRTWNVPYESKDFLMNHHFEQYKGRVFKYQTTTFILTCELKRSAFFGYDERKYNAFVNNVSKVLGFFNNYDIKASVMTRKEMINYVYRYFSMDFEDDACSFDNFSVTANGIKIGSKNIQCLSLIDVELVEMPSFIKPFHNEIINNRQFPHDLMKFIPYISTDTIVYNQVIFTVSQSIEKAKLEAKMKKHQSVPDPANNLCVEDIIHSMDDIERNGQLLVYSHFDLILADEKNLSSARNQVESFLSHINIRMSKQAFNQYELFRAAAPGNTYELRNYDRFLTTADVAVSLFYKERLPVTEESNLMIWFTDRQGVPVAIDPSDLPVRQNRIDNRNKFVLGPSGSGKSFLMNTMLHQYLLTDSDVVMVDVGHSYKGLCDYFGGRYVTYSEEEPISMNPFYIRQMEYNIEKVDFLINLILLLWKDTSAKVEVIEADIIRETVMSYYANYFAGQNEFTDEFAELYREKMIRDWNNEEVHDEDCDTYDKLMHKIDNFISKQRSYYIGEKDRISVNDLNFNSFYNFAKERIPVICNDAHLFYENREGINNKLAFDYRQFLKILEKFYGNGIFGQILNRDMDKTLFDEPFIVFEIDSIQNNKTLFPIVTLVIMDVFIQKMRNKTNRKVIVIEEAWKALASPLMSDYIRYLYKTVRKFYGEAITVTQELDDIIKSEVVRQSIIANAATFILCDQTKFKDNFSIVAEILSLSPVEQNKIFTVNALDNKGNRNKFKEFYIKRGTTGEVYGNEVSVYEYFTYTTEKPEKDAMQTYMKVYKRFHAALEAFVHDLIKTKVEKSDFCSIINHPSTAGYITKGISCFEQYVGRTCSDYRDSGMTLNSFLSKLTHKSNENEIRKDVFNLVSV
ncbi:MAG: conjugal transfer protein TraG [Tannerella sp.]|nr:conjugal transfer protein TraG [Tannerella sp.]